MPPKSKSKPKPKPKPKKRPPSPTPTTTSTLTRSPTPTPTPALAPTPTLDPDPAPVPSFTPKCSFTTPCALSPHFPHRKVITHIFGRNKAATKRLPAHIWAYYCRPHYQRSGYRAQHWAVDQCKLVQVVLGNMEGWGGVREFEVRLRRREVERLASSSSSSSLSSESLSLGGSEGDVGGGRNEDGDAYEDENEGGNERRTTRAKAKTKAKANNKSGGGGEGGGKGRKKPVIITSPVPDWLRREEVGKGKSFEDIRRLIELIRADLNEKTERAETRDADNKAKGIATNLKRGVRFPDIEILPTFYEWVTAEDEEEQEESEEEEEEGKKKRVMRVSRRGSVKKVQT